jgi:phosphoglycolate phosphatase-like HAD superfamily hydrolase
LEVQNTHYLIAIDSDGCALDAMEVKHRQCFTPAIIEIWQLQQIATQVMDVALRINLYSQDRGINRFVALAKLFEQLSKDLPEPQRAILPSCSALRQWVESSPALSESTLQEALQKDGNSELAKVLEWTREVNRRVSSLPHPNAFPHVAEFLEKLNHLKVPAYVVSSATRDIINKEWQAAGIAGYIQHFYGQEDGSKASVLKHFSIASANSSQILMIGDAPRDCEAARKSGSMFFPIIPGKEEQSWRIAKYEIIDAIKNKSLDAEMLKTRESEFWKVLQRG